jgi:hypothetical protein
MTFWLPEEIDRNYFDLKPNPCTLFMLGKLVMCYHIRADARNVIAVVGLRTCALFYHFREVAALLRST